MSAFGRLWRRAPSWRLALFSAVGCSAMAALFPPALPARLSGVLGGSLGGSLGSSGLLHPHLPHFGAGAASASAAPHFAAMPDAAAPDYGTLAAPPLGATRHGTISFAGRQVPLPAGDWIELVLVRDGGAHPLQSIVLGRTSAGQVTGILSLTAPPPLASVEDGVRPSGACYDPAALASQHADPGPDPLSRECWVMRPVRTSEIIDPKREFIIQRRAVARLQGMDVTVPPALVELRWFRSDAGGWMGATLLVRPQPDGGSRAQSGWMQRWGRLLHRGYDNAASGTVPADPTAG
ncbi:hypothetical protein [Lichenicoccus sp.]|uniref:hypothetical protein n=1 Tax=Lichenicoccus sp. TaxID=2781899 RepID=UPI003D13A1C2